MPCILREERASKIVFAYRFANWHQLNSSSITTELPWTLEENQPIGNTCIVNVKSIFEFNYLTNHCYQPNYHSDLKFLNPRGNSTNLKPSKTSK